MSIFSDKMRGFLLIGLGMLFCTSFSMQKEEKVDKIYIYTTEFNARTITDVECDRLLQAFGKNIDSFDATKDKHKIMKMLRGIDKYTSNDRQIDTRAKMYIYYASGKIDEYCFGNLDVCIKNGQYSILKNERITFYIDSCFWAHNRDR